MGGIFEWMGELAADTFVYWLLLPLMLLALFLWNTYTSVRDKREDERMKVFLDEARARNATKEAPKD